MDGWMDGWMDGSLNGCDPRTNVMKHYIKESVANREGNSFGRRRQKEEKEEQEEEEWNHINCVLAMR